MYREFWTLFFPQKHSDINKIFIVILILARFYPRVQALSAAVDVGRSGLHWEHLKWLKSSSQTDEIVTGTAVSIQ